MLTINKIYTMEITGMSSDGEGVGRIENEVVFVPGAIAGETCRVKIVNIGLLHFPQNKSFGLYRRERNEIFIVQPQKASPY